MKSFSFYMTEAVGAEKFWANPDKKQVLSTGGLLNHHLGFAVSRYREFGLTNDDLKSYNPNTQWDTVMFRKLFDLGWVRVFFLNHGTLEVHGYEKDAIRVGKLLVDKGIITELDVNGILWDDEGTITKNFSVADDSKIALYMKGKLSRFK